MFYTLFKVNLIPILIGLILNYFYKDLAPKDLLFFLYYSKKDYCTSLISQKIPCKDKKSFIIQKKII
jgi:hypothetical protein